MPTLAQSRRAAPGGALLALGIGLALYQLTSLALGPPAVRDLQISLIIPSVELQLPEPLVSNLEFQIGSRVAAIDSAGAAPAAAQPASISHKKPAAAPSRSIAVPAPAPVISVAPTPAVADDARETHYHDADERSLGLARRR